MLKKNCLIIILILIATFTSLIGFQSLDVNAEIYQLNNGDKFVYKYQNTYEYNLNKTFFPDENKEDYAYQDICYSRNVRNSLQAFNITNKNLSSSYIGVFDVVTKPKYEYNYYNCVSYIWEVNGWHKDYFDEYSDVVKIWETSSASYRNLANYSNLVFDPTGSFGITSFISQETRTYIVNDEVFTLTVDIYYSKTEVWEVRNSTWYNVETEEHTFSCEEYYYYVDNNTGVLLEIQEINNRQSYLSFYEYLQDYNTYVNFTFTEMYKRNYSHILTKASKFYYTSDNSFVPYFTFKDYSWDQPITNSTTEITFPFQFSEEVVKLELYVYNFIYSDWKWELVETKTITNNELNYTVSIDYFKYKLYEEWKQFMIIAYDSAGNVFMESNSIKDDRYPAPEWKSQIETNKVYKGVEDKELVLNYVYVYSDTFWELETKFYYNQSDLTQYTSNIYEGFGNSTLKIRIGNTWSVGDYTVNITFTDAVNTTYSKIVPLTIYPSGTDVEPPNLNIFWYEERNLGEPYKWVIGDNNNFWFETWDDNPNYFEFYVDGTLYNKSDYTNQQNYNYNFNELINETGLHNFTIISYDEFNNYKKESFWVKAYPEGTDLIKPNLASDIYSLYKLGSAKRFTFWISEKNPEYYEIKLDDAILSSGNYDQNFFEVFFTGRNVFNEVGTYTLSFFANDTSGNKVYTQWTIEVVPSIPENSPPTFMDLYDIDYYEIGSNIDLSFYIMDEYPDTYNLYINGNLTFSDVPYEGYGFYPENEQHLQLSNYIFDEGTYEIYVEAFDQWGNNNTITIYVNAYREPYQKEYDPPQIDTNMEYWHTIEYIIGTSETVKFTLYDANPDYYELYIDGNLKKSDSYADGTTLSFDLKVYITEEGTHTIKLIAYDVFGNSNELEITINAVYESGSGDNTTQDKQTFNLPLGTLSIFIALPVITIITKKYKKFKA